MLSITSARAREEKSLFPHVMGKLGRSLEFEASLGHSAGPKQKVAPRRRHWRIIAQGGVVGNTGGKPLGLTIPWINRRQIAFEWLGRDTGGGYVWRQQS